MVRFLKPKLQFFTTSTNFYFLGFTVKNSAEAVKISEIVKTLASMSDIPENNVTKFEPIIAQLINRYVYNETVTECMSSLIASQHSTCIPSVNSWITMLPQLLISSKVTFNHVEAIKLLFKRRNPILQEAFMKLASIRKYYFFSTVMKLKLTMGFSFQLKNLRKINI